MIKSWDKLPKVMRNESVKYYYDILYQKRGQLYFKRVFDIVLSLLLLILFCPVFLIMSILIKKDSFGPILFKQIRITQYGKKFKIFKFRTMIQNAEKLGTQVTTKEDARVTNIGRYLRRYRLDELPQVINVLLGDMSFVGTRPEVEKYIRAYDDEMLATLLLPAGITSEASIEYKDEDELLKDHTNADEIYINLVLREKMKYNLNSLAHYSNYQDIKTMIRTLIKVIK